MGVNVGLAMVCGLLSVSVHDLSSPSFFFVWVLEWFSLLGVYDGV